MGTHFVPENVIQDEADRLPLVPSTPFTPIWAIPDNEREKEH